MNQVKNWCSKWSQQSIGVEFENDLFYVDTETKFAGGGFTQYGEPMGFEEESDSVYEIHHKPNYNSKNPYLIWDKIDGVYIAEFPNRQRALHFIDYKSIGYMSDGGEVEDEVYNAYVVWINDYDEAFFDGGWWSIEDAEDRVSDIEVEEEGKPKYVVFAVEYDEDYFENKNWDITRMKSYKPYPLTRMARGGKTYEYETYHNTLASALNEADKYVESKGLKFTDETYFPDVTMGGISYGQTARLTRGIQREGKKKEDVLIVVIYRMDSGKYELTMYTSYEKGGYMENGGDIAESNLQMLRSNAKAIKHHAEELEGELNDDTQVEAWVVAKGERAATDLSDITHYLDGKKFSLGGMTAGRYYRDNSGEEFKFIGKVDSGQNKGRFLFSDGKKSVYKDLEDFEGGKPKETKLFGFFEDGGDLEQGVDLFEDYENMPASVVETISKYDLESGDYRELEKALQDLKKYGYTFEYELDGQPYDLRKIGQKGKSEYYAKGGSIKSIEKRVAEVNELIKRGNELGIEVVDEGNTWQAPMKYKPLKYSNGVLYVSFEQMDLYKYSKEYVKEWDKKSYKVGKYDNSYGFKGEAGSMQREVLTDIARMYRKPLKSYDTYGYFEDGGEVNKVNPEEIKVKIEQILDKVVPSFYKGVSIQKNIFDTGNNIRIFIAASDYKINGVSGQLPQVVSLSLDLSDMDLHPQVFGGNGGRAISRKPNMSDPDEKYLAAKSVKVPFRTPQPNEKAVLDAIKRFAENYKKTLADNREVLLYQDVVDYDKLLADSQYADGGKVDYWGDIDVKAREKYKPIGIYSDAEKEVSAFKYGFIWGKSQKKYDRDLAENEGIKKYKPVGFSNVDRKQAVAFWEGAKFAHSEEGQKMAEGGMAKGGVIASSETKEGIEKLISDYYYSSKISLKKVDNKDEYEVSNSKGKINGVKVIVKKGRYQFVNSDKMAMGGTFAEGVKAIEKRLVGTKVNPKFQKEYGKTYDKAEANEAATKIKGKIRAMELAKKYKKKK